MLCSLLSEMRGSLAEGSPVLWLSHLTVVKHNREHQSTANLQVSFAILHALVGSCSLTGLSVRHGSVKQQQHPQARRAHIHANISGSKNRDVATIWAILTESSINITFCKVFLEALSTTVMSRPVTNLNFTPFCNSVKEVTQCHYMACKIINIKSIHSP